MTKKLWSTSQPEGMCREVVAFDSAYRAVEVLPAQVELFQDKSDHQIQQTLHEWSWLLYDLVHSERNEKTRWSGITLTHSIGYSLVRALTRWFGGRYDEGTARNITDLMKPVFLQHKTVPGDIGQWAACFRSHGPDVEVDQGSVFTMPVTNGGTLPDFVTSDCVSNFGLLKQDQPPDCVSNFDLSNEVQAATSARFSTQNPTNLLEDPVEEWMLKSVAFTGIPDNRSAISGGTSIGRSLGPTFSPKTFSIPGSWQS
jgi:hypothetical protein